MIGCPWQRGQPDAPNLPDTCLCWLGMHARWVALS